MANVTSKKMSDMDGEQILRSIYSDNDMTIATSGFVSGKKGHRIETRAVSLTVDEYRYLDIFNTQTGSITSGSAIVTGLNTSTLAVGDYVSLSIGVSGIPLNVKISTVDSITQVTLDTNATATGSVSLRFAKLLRRELIEYNNAAHDVLLISERVE